MQKRRMSSLSILLAGTLLAAAGCSDDDEKIQSCKSGSCGGSSGDTGVGGANSGGSENTSGGTTGEGGLPGTGGIATTSGGASEAGSTGLAGSTGESAGTTSAAGSTSTAGATNTAGSTSTAGAKNTAGAAGVTTSTSKGGATGTGGATNTAGTVGIAGAAGSAGTTVVPGVAILKYDFEDGTGTKVTDTSGNGHDGALSGATWSLNTEGRNAIGSTFATADAAVAVPANLFTNASGLTVSAWVKLSANEPGNRLFDFGSGPGNHIYFTFNNQAGGMELGVQINDGALTSLFTTATLPLNVWKHVTVVLAASGAHLYVDGWEVARSAAIVVAPSALGATNSNWIGKSQVPDPAFAGSIDEFYVYDNAIALADIRKLAWPKTDYSIWHFDETDGTVATDSSDFKRDATMVRATFAAGVVGNAAQLYNPSNTDEPPAGADQYVQLPVGVVMDCTAGYTIASWVNVIAMHIHARLFEFSNDTASAVFGRTMGGSTQQWALGDFTDGTARYASIAYTWPLGTWHHVAAVRDGQVLHAYIDGSESGTQTPSTMPATVPPVSSLGSTLYNYIGRTRDSAATTERRRLHGFVDEFLLSCRPYTSNEIKLLAVRP